MSTQSCKFPAISAATGQNPFRGWEDSISVRIGNQEHSLFQTEKGIPSKLTVLPPLILPIRTEIL